MLITKRLTYFFFSEFYHGVLKLNGICPTKTSIYTLLDALKLSNDIFEIDLSRSVLDQNEINAFLNNINDGPTFLQRLKIEEINLNYDTIINLSSLLMTNTTLQR